MQEPEPRKRKLTPELLEELRTEAEAARIACDMAGPAQKRDAVNRLRSAVKKLTDAMLDGKAPL